MTNLKSLISQINKQEKLVNRLEKKFKKEYNDIESDLSQHQMVITQSESQIADTILKALKSCLDKVEENESRLIGLV